MAAGRVPSKPGSDDRQGNRDKSKDEDDQSQDSQCLSLSIQFGDLVQRLGITPAEQEDQPCP